ncbi:hypothetical protein AB4455_18790 [Vibrio sp. 10N.261.46.E12]|uniref:hypothetical protein n=1 Tax=unclassified Vibrio TaxID=2614977 RepID=UPI000977947B|nr:MULTISPECIES: hypothetical protein [unclassified Vibrio]OMO38518.1 hypothetical protein BH584_17305 [Vibrio sp. 10N.261.45.E1]PML87650.1 hypothetical protein BCT66_11755 [Vibrio sp. 10N.261.49.E11]PMM73921.1 hypothetical protein BCT48_26015 [Vibrio sp. 10N.261.46.F12]PMM90166.1 hypothetical protein BCT46_23830 [Vibrio sp. 10N.261.46.E8]PMN28041.1 hypothetical protein BCT34_19770 [Vibrio sp. 10N.261.45.E2]
MVGFIGLLSATLGCLFFVLILVSSAYEHAVINKASSSLLYTDNGDYLIPVSNYYLTEESVDDYLKYINNLNNDEVIDISVGCTYGKDLTIDMADAISLYNTIKIDQADVESIYKIKIKTTELGNDRKDYCFISSKRTDVSTDVKMTH